MSEPKRSIKLLSTLQAAHQAVREHEQLHHAALLPLVRSHPRIEAHVYLLPDDRPVPTRALVLCLARVGKPQALLAVPLPYLEVLRPNTIELAGAALAARAEEPQATAKVLLCRSQADGLAGRLEPFQALFSSWATAAALKECLSITGSSLVGVLLRASWIGRCPSPPSFSAAESLPLSLWANWAI